MRGVGRNREDMLVMNVLGVRCLGGGRVPRAAGKGIWGPRQSLCGARRLGRHLQLVGN